MTSYTQNFTSQTTVTVTGANHGIGSNAIGVTCYTGSNGSGSAIDKSLYTYTIDATTKNVAVTFNSSTSGSVRVMGAISDTSGADDWKVTSPTSTTLKIADGADSNYQCRSCGIPVSNSRYFTNRSFTITLVNGYTPAAYLWAYLDPYKQRLTIGLGTGWVGPDPTVPAGVLVDHGIDSLPSGMVGLGHVYVSSVFGTVTDDRGWS